MTPCLCCNRPRTSDRFCQTHQAMVNAEKERRSTVKPKIEYYAHHQGNAVGFVRQPDGKLRAVKIPMSKIPKKEGEKVINLNVWCEGFTKERIEALKWQIRELYKLPRLIKAAKKLS